MPVNIGSPNGVLTIQCEKLSQKSFAAFGTVIENPAPALIPSSKLDASSVPANAVQANQGSALKYLDVTHMLDLYNLAPSKMGSKAVMNMFVCAPRHLMERQEQPSSTRGYFLVKILERHPFTTQTFIPLGLSATDSREAQYIVIVAPGLTPSSADESLPVPPPTAGGGGSLPGRGLPDLTRIKAFIADGAQAVTYGAGTWHAPMVVVGTKAIDFVVVQYANGVDVEDCQEASLEEKSGGKLMVAVPEAATPQYTGMSKL
jgi:ureidoglycolate lyase